MHKSVLEAWHSFSEPLEGRILHMYLDIKGLVTCGVGNLIDSVREAQKLPWKRQSSGELATSGEVAAAWRRLKDRQDLARRGTVHALALTGLVLSDEDVDALVARKLAENDAFITGWFPNFQAIPADAELAIHSMAWAVGPAFNRKFPNFTRVALAEDWRAAALACTIREQGNPGVVPRNKANRICFANAATVVESGLAPEVLHWPSVALPGASVPQAALVEDAAAVTRALATEPAITSLHDLIREDSARQQRAQMDTLDEEPESDPDPEGHNQS
jgi:GH24 family phage-related lysozyme (muramidase)